METTSKGIVLKVVPYQDNDNVVEILLDNNIKIAIFAPGTRKMESKNRQSLIVGNIVEFSYFKARIKEKMSRLKTMESIELFIPEDDTKYKLVSLIADFARGYEFEKRNDIFFNNYINFIKKLKEGKDTFYDYMILIANIISDSNSSFKFKTCSICGLSKPIKSFSLREGGIICEDDAKKTNPVFNKNLLICMYFLLTNNYDKLIDIKINKADEEIIKITFNEYLNEILGLYPKV
jgi:DNA repair protein RecO (recombination protein O)